MKRTTYTSEHEQFRDPVRSFIDRRVPNAELHGGYGYMNEYRVARDCVDARIHTIYGGTTEIMKGIIGKSLLS